MLTRFASNKSSLVKIVAVAAAIDAREGTNVVSGATDAELRTSNLAASLDDARCAAASNVAPAVLQSNYKTPLEPRRTYADKKPDLVVRAGFRGSRPDRRHVSPRARFSPRRR